MLVQAFRTRTSLGVPLFWTWGLIWRCYGRVNGSRFGHFQVTKLKVTKPRTEALLRVTSQDLKTPTLGFNDNKKYGALNNTNVLKHRVTISSLSKGVCCDARSENVDTVIYESLRGKRGMQYTTLNW